LHVDIVDDLSECIERCGICFPNASITLMINGDGACSHVLSKLFGDKRIQGLLPFTLKLDIWLAAIWLLLNGGEYYPYGIMQSLEQIARDNHVRSRHTAITNGISGRIAESKPVDTLTLRERQILEFLSEGLQNKTIADRLNLSGHTVKVHVHNLIRKLKVHNRTQAAAIYRNHLEQSSLQSAVSWNTQRAVSRTREMMESITNA
ncbi:MAG: response regulator transcription factor, partial [Pyrinomonadaceae bacterium]